MSFKSFLTEEDIRRHQAKVLKRYTLSSNGINTKLKRQNGENKPFDKHIASLDQITSQPHNGHQILYRGIHEKEAKKLAIGSIIHHHGYISTSKDKDTANLFAFAKRGHDSHILKISAPSGTKGHTVGDYHANPEGPEHEFLIHRGTTLKVDSHHYDKDNGQHIWSVSIHKQRDD